MVAVMKSVSIAIDGADTDNFPSFYKYVGYMYAGASCFFGPWMSFKDYKSVYEEKHHVIITSLFLSHLKIKFLQVIWISFYDFCSTGIQMYSAWIWSFCNLHVFLECIKLLGSVVHTWFIVQVRNKCLFFQIRLIRIAIIINETILQVASGVSRCTVIPQFTLLCLICCFVNFIVSRISIVNGYNNEASANWISTLVSSSRHILERAYALLAKDL